MALAALDWSAPALEGITLDLLKEKGWARLNLPDPDHYVPHAEGNFPTASGKCEFRSSLAEQAGNLVVPVFREGYNEFQPGGTVDPLPHYVPPTEDVEGSDTRSTSCRPSRTPSSTRSTATWPTSGGSRANSR